MEKQKGLILVTGGAGYIGSHTVKELVKCGYKVIILDNLSAGNKRLIHPEAVFIEGDCGDSELTDRIFSKYKIDAVIHFAASIEVEESMHIPGKYIENNICSGKNLLESMKKNNCMLMIFSSSAAVYGIPKKIPVRESDDTKTINCYGFTKLAFEEMLRYYDLAYGIKSISLRYFNASGADPDGELGSMHKHPTHLIPIILQAALGERDKIKIFGTDYQTADGTCIRDFIHVTDLANAHIFALSYLMKNKISDVFNVGTGKGVSVREMIKASEEVLNTKINYEESERRSGDPPSLIANAEKIKKLGWSPKYSDLRTIIKTAYNWELKKREERREKMG